MGDLSKNFMYKEMFVSNDHPGLADNAYSYEQNNELFKARAKRLCLNVLQPTREFIGKPVKILSGYRDKFLNQAVGGVFDSDHLFCIAADISGDFNVKDLFLWMKDNLCYRQLIYYPNNDFIHTSVNCSCKEFEHKAMVKYNSEYVDADWWLQNGI